MSDYNYLITEFKNTNSSKDATVTGTNITDPITVDHNGHNDPDPAITVPVATSSDQFNNNHMTVTLGSLPSVRFFSDGTNLKVTTGGYGDAEDMTVEGEPDPGDNNITILISELSSNSWVVGEIDIDDEILAD